MFVLDEREGMSPVLREYVRALAGIDYYAKLETTMLECWAYDVTPAVSFACQEGACRPCREWPEILMNLSAGVPHPLTGISRQAFVRDRVFLERHAPELLSDAPHWLGTVCESPVVFLPRHVPGPGSFYGMPRWLGAYRDVRRHRSMQAILDDLPYQSMQFRREKK